MRLSSQTLRQIEVGGAVVGALDPGGPVLAADQLRAAVEQENPARIALTLEGLRELDAGCAQHDVVVILEAAARVGPDAASRAARPIEIALGAHRLIGPDRPRGLLDHAIQGCFRLLALLGADPGHALVVRNPGVDARAQGARRRQRRRGLRRVCLLEQDQAAVEVILRVVLRRRRGGGERFARAGVVAHVEARDAQVELDVRGGRIEPLGLLEGGQGRGVVARLELALGAQVRGGSGRSAHLGQRREGLRALAGSRQRHGAREGDIVAICSGSRHPEQQCREHHHRNGAAPPRAQAGRFPATHRPANAAARSISVLGSGTPARNAIE
jgi:hypothetical protein